MQLRLLRKMLFALLFVITASFQIYAQEMERCSDYIWDINYLPISYLGFDDAPAKIIYTAGGNNAGEWKYIPLIGLRNLSGKTISAIKFQWYLFPINIQLKKNILPEERAIVLEKIVLAQGEISIVETGEFQPKEELEVKAKISCEKVFEAIGNVKNANKFAIEFVVSEISFSDSSNWNRN